MISEFCCTFSCFVDIDKVCLEASTCNAMAPFEVVYHSAETSEHVGVFVGYWSARNMVIVAFRGSQYLINFIQDLTSYAVDANYPMCDSATPLPEQDTWQQTRLRARSTGGEQGDEELEGKTKCKVHSGFFDDWKDVREEVLNATASALAGHAGAQVWVTGHSMGGAMAVFCALDIKIRLKPTFIGLHTFGQPRVGNAAFAAFAASTIPNAMRVVHQDDVVPHLPPMTGAYIPLTNFHHNPTEVWQTGTEDSEFRLCDASGEDPHCSNSLPSWDRSVEAHLWYVGWPMHCETPA